MSGLSIIVTFHFKGPVNWIIRQISVFQFNVKQIMQPNSNTHTNLVQMVKRRCLYFHPRDWQRHQSSSFFYEYRPHSRLLSTATERKKERERERWREQGARNNNTSLLLLGRDRKQASGRTHAHAAGMKQHFHNPESSPRQLLVRWEECDNVTHTHTY